LSWWCSWTCFMNNYEFMHSHEHRINFQNIFFCIKCLSTWFNILYILSKHGKRKGFIFMISLSKYTLIKQVVVWKPHCITQYFVQKEGLHYKWIFNNVHILPYVNQLAKLWLEWNTCGCCGVALLVKLLNYCFFASWIIFI
jgi:hypothetical protein